MELGFGSKQSPDLNSKEAADQFPGPKPFRPPDLDRMRPSEVVQRSISIRKAAVDPAVWARRVGTGSHNLIERSIHAEFKPQHRPTQ